LEGVVTRTRIYLEVASVAGETIVIHAGEKKPASFRILDPEFSIGEQLDLLVKAQANFGCHLVVPSTKKGPSHLSIVERLGRGTIGKDATPGAGDRQSNLCDRGMPRVSDPPAIKPVFHDSSPITRWMLADMADQQPTPGGGESRWATTKMTVREPGHLRAIQGAKDGRLDWVPG